VITSVAAWLPELPPLAITSGMKATSQACGSATISRAGVRRP
jgi:hypothetical protein